jgi:hypothetical protein
VRDPGPRLVHTLQNRARMKRLAYPALVALATTACDSSDPLAPPPEKLAASYRMTSQLVVPAEAALPPPAYDLAVAVRGLRTEPGRTVFTLLEKAGVPVLADLKAALPGALEEKLEGWVGGAIQDHLDLARLDPVIAVLDTALADIDLESVLETTPGSHRLVSLGFASLGEGVVLPVSALDSPLLTRPVVLTAAGEDLVVLDHAYSLPIGEYAWTAIDQVVTAEHGTGVRGLLTGSVDCAAVAAAVADKGALGLEVGHERELRELCEAGVELVADEVEAQVTGIVWEALRFQRGQAAVVDTDADGVAEALTGGVWTATIDAGQGARSVPGSFAGARE